MTALAVLLITSCEKENTATPYDSNNPAVKTIMDTKSGNTNRNKSEFYLIGSSLNPHNIVGYEHNVILDYMRSSFEPSKSNEELFLDVVDFASSNLGYTKLDSVFDSGDMDSLIINYDVPSNFYNQISTMKNSDVISNLAYDYLKSMLDIGIEASCSNCTYDQVMEGAIQEIQNIEENLYYDNTISSSEKQMIFLSLAVCKYSMDFWRAEAQRSSTNYSIELLAGPGSEMDFVPNISWWQADAVGAIATFYAGGGVLMGINVGLGAGAMAVGGAMASMG